MRRRTAVEPASGRDALSWIPYISARHLDEAWARTDFFDFGAVVIDYDLKNDIAASAFRQRFITLNLNEDAEPVAVVMELSNLFNRGSELVQ